MRSPRAWLLMAIPALALLASCGNEPPSEQLLALRSDPITQVEISSGSEFSRTENDNGDFKRRDNSASIAITFRPDGDNTNEQVLDELIEAARENGWPIEIGEQFNRGQKTINGFEANLSLSIFEDESGVFISLRHPDQRAG